MSNEIKSLKQYIDTIQGDLPFDEYFWNLEPVKKLKELGKSDSQIKKFTYLAKSAGSIKLDHELDSVQAVNELRGKGDVNDSIIDELVSLALWSIRRLPKIHKEFAYKELVKITPNHEFVKQYESEYIKPKPSQEDGTWRNPVD